MDTHTCMQWQVKGGGKSHFYLSFFYNTSGRVRLSFWLLCFGTCCQLLPEKAMAPHSSTLAWKIPWMEEPGGLQSMGSQRVGHD